jgi:hypothetical protein
MPLSEKDHLIQIHPDVVFAHQVDGGYQVGQFYFGVLAAFVFQKVEEAGQHLHVHAFIRLLHNVFEDAHFGDHILEELLQRNTYGIFQQFINIIDRGTSFPYPVCLLNRSVCAGSFHLVDIAAHRCFWLVIACCAKVFF